MQRPVRSRICSLIVIAAAVALTGCKLEIRVPHGGKVVSSDGAYVCESGQSCVIDVVDLFFDQTFIAEPAEGFSFLGWKDKDRYLCGGETGPCRLATAAFEGDPMMESVLESDETFFLQPRFALILDCPDDKSELVVSPAPPPG
mgnify:FL=1